MEGSTFVSPLDDRHRPWKEAAYTMVARKKNSFGRSVRTEAYRYKSGRKGDSPGLARDQLYEAPNLNLTTDFREPARRTGLAPLGQS